MGNRVEKTQILHPLQIGTTVSAFKEELIIVDHVDNVAYKVMDDNNKNRIIMYSDVDYFIPMGVSGSQLVKDMVNHPQHYGGKDNPMEVIKIIDHYQLPFSLGNTLKYILRADKKANKLEDLKKAAWYLQHEITKLEKTL